MSSATDFQWKAAGMARLVGLGGPTVWKCPRRAGVSGFQSSQPHAGGGIWAGIWDLARIRVMQTATMSCSDHCPEAWPAVHSTALCGLCVSLFPSAENNSIIKAVKCLREGAVVFPEGADMEEGIQRSLLHAHKALGTVCACPRRARARQEMRHSIHRDPVAQGKGKQRRNKE